jgi:hypothetical protein
LKEGSVGFLIGRVGFGVLEGDVVEKGEVGGERWID